MFNKKRKAQIGTEYLILVSFIVFLVITFAGISLLYSVKIRDTIKFSQLEKFSDKIISSAESVFFSGEPSKVTITVYLPEGVQSIVISGKDMIYDIETNSGVSKIAYSGNVIMEGTISSNQGIKRLEIASSSDKVIISETS